MKTQIKAGGDLKPGTGPGEANSQSATLSRLPHASRTDKESEYANQQTTPSYLAEGEDADQSRQRAKAGDRTWRDRPSLKDSGAIGLQGPGIVADARYEPSPVGCPSGQPTGFPGIHGSANRISI